MLPPGYRWFPRPSTAAAGYLYDPVRGAQDVRNRRRTGGRRAPGKKKKERKTLTQLQSEGTITVMRAYCALTFFTNKIWHIRLNYTAVRFHPVRRFFEYVSFLLSALIPLSQTDRSSLITQLIKTRILSKSCLSQIKRLNKAEKNNLIT